MAIACLRLFTTPPLPRLPDFKVPWFFLRIALSTLLPAALPYFRLLGFFTELFVAAIVFSPDSLSGAKHPQGLSYTSLSATSFARSHQKL
jgi:hypothetical protein